MATEEKQNNTNWDSISNIITPKALIYRISFFLIDFQHLWQRDMEKSALDQHQLYLLKVPNKP